jgi:hypothetical protein
LSGESKKDGLVCNAAYPFPAGLWLHTSRLRLVLRLTRTAWRAMTWNCVASGASFLKWNHYHIEVLLIMMPHTQTIMPLFSLFIQHRLKRSIEVRTCQWSRFIF